jgi:hypothetical protein
MSAHIFLNTLIITKKNMKPLTSFILTSSTVAIAYETLRGINMSQRLNAGKYTEISAIDAWMSKKNLMFTNRYLTTAEQSWRPIGYEFEDVIIFSVGEDDMKTHYDKEIIKRCLPKFMK